MLYSIRADANTVQTGEIMKKLFAVSALGLVALSAFGQDSVPVSLRLGLAFPVISDTRDAHSEFFAIGGQFKLKDLNASERYDTSLELSVDYYGRGDFRHIPILVNYVGHSRKGDSFWSAGAGFGFVGRPKGVGTESIGRLAYQVGIGLNLSSGSTGSFVELRFLGSEASNVNALGFYYGLRF
jgi:hypothetical protein